jgi:hypothetical protein
MKPRNNIAAAARGSQHPHQESAGATPAKARPALALCAALVAICAPTQAQTWETVDDFPAATATAYAMAADNEGNIFVAGSTRDSANWPTAVVMKSSDGGQTWDNDPSTPEVDEMCDALPATDNSPAYFAAISVRRVTTGGSTFEDQVVSAGRAGRVYGGPPNPLTGTLTSPWQVRRTRDGGSTWETVDQFVHPTYNQLPSYTRPRGVALGENGTIYVVGSVEERITTTVKRNTVTSYVNHWLIRRGAPNFDGSLQWSTFDFAFPVSLEQDRVETVFPSAVTCVGNRVFVVGGGGLYWHVLQSNNDGLTWMVADNVRLGSSGSSHANAIAADSQGYLYVAGSHEQLVTTGQGKNRTTVLERSWLVRRGSPDGTNWSTIEQLVNPAGSSAASGVTADLSGDVHVTGYYQPASENARWITRQRSAATGAWSTTDDFSLASTDDAAGIAITADPFGDLFAAGSAYDSAGVRHGWLVRRTLAP